MKKSGFKSRPGFTSKSGFKRKRKHTPNNRIRDKKKSSPFMNQVDKTDRVHSQFIRMSHADEYGVVQCYTCNYRGFWKKGGIECGHYHSRANLGTRWSEINCQPQCHHCNTVLGGNLKVFKANLIRDYGKKVVEELNQLAEKVVRLKIEQVREIRLSLNKKLRDVKIKSGL